MKGVNNVLWYRKTTPQNGLHWLEGTFLALDLMSIMDPRIMFGCRSPTSRRMLFSRLSKIRGQ